MGERTSDPANANDTRPLAPRVFATAVHPSMSLRVASAFPGTTSARIEPPSAIESRKTPKDVPRKTSVRSTSSRPKRVSGRSVPNRFMASSYVIRGKGLRCSGFFANLSNTAV